MRGTSVDLIGGYYRADSLPWASQDTVNWLPVAAEVAGTLTVKRLATPPGLRPYQQIGTGPIRGMHDCEGLRLVVSGKWLYRISNDGVGVPIGQIPGVGRVQITHNQFKTGYQVLVENGQGGGGYVYDTTTQAFGRITDAGYPGSISSDYLDSFMLGVEPQGRFWFHSNLADATDYNTLDRYEAEASPDRIVGLAVSQFEVVVFGQRTIEFFYNAGLETGTFQNRRQAITRGCASRHTIQKLDNTLFWLGDDGIVYRLNGYAPQPVSTNAIADAIAGYNWSEAFAFVWEDKGFKVYYLTFPDGQTFGYDVVSRLWHRRESFELVRWRPTHSVKWGRDWFVGDFQSGRMFRLDWDYHLEGSEPIISERVSPVLYDDQSLIGIPNAELVFGTGQGPGTVAAEFPVQPQPPAISGAAPDATRAVAYPGYSYTITGGQTPYAVTLVGGALPAGLSISSAGAITGTPTQNGAFSFTLRVAGGNGLWSELTDSVLISSPAIALVTTSGTTRATLRRSTAGSWASVSSDQQAGQSIYAAGLPSGRFVAWRTGGAYYSDNNGTTWTATASSINSTGGSRSGDARGAVVVFGAGQPSGVIYVSTDSGTTYAARTAPSNASGGAVIVQSGPNAGRIWAPHTVAATASSYSDDLGVTWSNGAAAGIGVSSGRTMLSSEDFQYLGGNIGPGASSPKLAVFQNGATLVRSLTLTLAANAVVASLARIPYGGGWRLLIGTSVGEIWASDDNGATAVKLTTPAVGSVSAMVFDGARVLVGTGTGQVLSTTDGGGSWAVEPTVAMNTVSVIASLPNG